MFSIPLSEAKENRRSISTLPEKSTVIVCPTFQPAKKTASPPHENYFQLLSKEINYVINRLLGGAWTELIFCAVKSTNYMQIGSTKPKKYSAWFFDIVPG